MSNFINQKVTYEVVLHDYRNTLGGKQHVQTAMYTTYDMRYAINFAEQARASDLFKEGQWITVEEVTTDVTKREVQRYE